MQVLFLLLAAPVLGEILSGNTHFSTLLAVPLWGLLLIFYYGVPAVIIREVAIRYRLSVAGVFLLGLAYGIYNEGIAAHTLFAQTDAPVALFNNYAYAMGINFSWMPTILLYHALNSILYPILLTAYLFPKTASRPWLPRWALGALVVFALGVVPTVFPSTFHNPLLLAPLLKVLVGMALLIAAAFFFKVKQGTFYTLQKNPHPLRAAVFGFGYGLLFFAGFYFAQTHPPIIAYWIYLALLPVAVCLVWKKFDFALPALALFGLGNYLLVALKSMVDLAGAPDMLVGESILALLFVYLIVSARKTIASRAV